MEYHCKEVDDDFMTIKVSKEEILFEIYNVNDNGDSDFTNVILTRKQVADMIAKLQSKLYD